MKPCLPASSFFHAWTKWSLAAAQETSKRCGSHSDGGGGEQPSLWFPPQNPGGAWFRNWTFSTFRPSDQKGESNPGGGSRIRNSDPIQFRESRLHWIFPFHEWENHEGAKIISLLPGFVNVPYINCNFFGQFCNIESRQGYILPFFLQFLLFDQPKECRQIKRGRRRTEQCRHQLPLFPRKTQQKRKEFQCRFLRVSLGRLLGKGEKYTFFPFLVRGNAGWVNGWRGEKRGAIKCAQAIDGASTL